MSTSPQRLDPITELRYALAQSDTENPASTFRDHLLAAAMQARAPGMAIDAPESISGLETFRRLTARLSRLLAGLPDAAWTLPAIRDLDVQGLVGHLIGVEHAFAAALLGDDSAADADHVRSTQPNALRQQGRLPQETFEEWALVTERTIAFAADTADTADPQRVIRFHGIQLELDAFLVVRSFEIWTHDEDIRRALGREEVDPDAEVLTRMTALATTLLPVGIALVAGDSTPSADATARLVLTGPGGGSWDIPLQGRGVTRARPGARFDGHLVVDSAAFCRVVANRADLRRSGAVVSQDPQVAELLLLGAAALALD
jgi:uncharacterized protein (TIGR03083 family)